MGHESSGGAGGDSSAPAPSPARRLAQNKYQKAVEIEKILSTTIQSKGSFDPSVRILRSNLRELYESIVLEDHEFAESREIEQLLWRLHYTRIEEFRTQIRKTMAAVANSSGPANVPLPGNKPSGGRHQVQKVTAVFRSFLSEATGFYHDLILKIRSKHKLSEDDLSNNAIESKETGEDEHRTAEIKRCQLSCHRCLLYLGDLARYKEYYSDSDPKNHDWSIAAGFYVKASALWPASGNPHNQLAVLATYVGDEMLAVYHYFRSLAAEVPFHTAKDNLVLLFEKNRQAYLRLVSTSNTKLPEGTGNSGLKNDDDKSPNKHVSNINEATKHFQIVFVRLHGILFTKTSLEAFEEVRSITVKKLHLLLELIDNNAETFPRHDSLKASEQSIFIQIVSILIFIVHHVNAGADSHQPTYAEILQRSAVLKHAFTATFQCAAHLLEYCIKADDPSSCMVLPSALILVEWLSCRPDIATGTEMKEEENFARCSFWKNCVDLLNKFLDESSDHRYRPNETSFLNIMLSEDYELWGFVPLLPSQSKINFTRRSTTGLGSKKEKQCRIERLIQAGKIISTLFEGNDDTGIYYDRQANLFLLASEKKKVKKKEVVKPDITAEETSPKMSEPINVPVDLHQPVKDDEDEELIVFKPLLKTDIHTHICVSDSGNNGASSLAVEAVQNSLFKHIPENSVGPGATSERMDARNLSPDVLQSQVPPMMANVHAFASSPLASIMTGIQPPVNSVNHLDSKPETSLEAYKTFQNLKGPLDRMPSIVPGSGYMGSGHPDWRTGSGIGLIPDQHPWTPISGNINWQPHNMVANWTDIGPANVSFGFQSATNLDKRPATAGFPQNLISTDVASSTSQMSNVANTSALNSILQSKQSFSVANAQTNSVSQAESVMHGLGFLASDNPISRALPSSLNENEKAPQKVVSGPVGMRPPPGFGPLPSKSPSPLSTSSAVPLVKPALPGQIGSHRGAATIVDRTTDSGWLDSFGPLKKEVEQVGNMVPGRSGSGFGWLPGGTYPSLDAPVSPFPGMKPSDRLTNSQQPQSSVNHELLQRQQLIEQHQHQLLLQQQRRQLQQLHAAQLAAYQFQKQQQHMQQQRHNMMSEEQSQVNGPQPQQVQQQEQMPQQPQHPRQQPLVQSIWSNDHT